MSKQKNNPEESEQTSAGQRSGVDRRLSVLDRRSGLDRRRINVPVSVERRSGLDRRQTETQISGERRSGLDRRRGPGIRREADRKAAEEGEMTAEQFEFVMAVDNYKRTNNRPFPTLTEILEVVKNLGYKKIS